MKTEVGQKKYHEKLSGVILVKLVVSRKWREGWNSDFAVIVWFYGFVLLGFIVRSILCFYVMQQDHVAQNKNYHVHWARFYGKMVDITTKVSPEIY